MDKRRKKAQKKPQEERFFLQPAPFHGQLFHAREQQNKNLPLLYIIYQRRKQRNPVIIPSFNPTTARKCRSLSHIPVLCTISPSALVLSLYTVVTIKEICFLLTYKHQNNNNKSLEGDIRIIIIFLILPITTSSHGRRKTEVVAARQVLMIKGELINSLPKKYLIPRLRREQTELSGLIFIYCKEQLFFFISHTTCGFVQRR